MCKIILKIFYSLIFCVIGTAFVGVNICRLHCVKCDTVAVQVQMLPQAEEGCVCEDDCSCCHKEQGCAEEDHRDNGSHVFYKVTDYSLTEKAAGADVVFYCVIPSFVLSFVPMERPEHSRFPDEVTFPDLPPSQQSLCIYRC